MEKIKCAYQVIKDYWDILREFYKKEMNEAEWDDFIYQADIHCLKYKDDESLYELARDIRLAITQFLEREKSK